MPATGSNPRPERKRAAVPTYNLRILSGLPTRSRKSDHKKCTSLSTRDLTPLQIQMDLDPAMDRDTSTALSSPLSSPPVSTCATPFRRTIAERQEHRTGPGSTRRPFSMTTECFKKHDSARGHYHSATELYDRGVWVGFLAPDRQNESYKGLPPYSELKVNCKNMELPYPPATTGSSAKTHLAICESRPGYKVADRHYDLPTRLCPPTSDMSLTLCPLGGGCSSEQSRLLTLREEKFVHKKVGCSSQSLITPFATLYYPWGLYIILVIFCPRAFQHFLKAHLLCQLTSDKN